MGDWHLPISKPGSVLGAVGGKCSTVPLHFGLAVPAVDVGRAVSFLCVVFIVFIRS